MAELIVCIPDVHAPYHHPRAWRAVTSMVKAVRPDRVVQLGDFLDMLAPARWSRGLAAEYAAGVRHEARTGRALLAELRKAFHGPLDMIEGNHEARLRAYVQQHAPALAGLVPTIPELLDLADLGINLQAQPLTLGQGVVAIHGKRLSSTQSAAGQSAYKERVRHGRSVVQGHTHRLGVGWDTADKTRFWFECGWMGDITRAGYLDFAGVANWQLGLGALVVDGNHVSPLPIPMRRDGSFIFERTEFRG